MTELETSMVLCLNQSKCEVYAPDLSLTQDPPFSAFTKVDVAMVELLCAPLFRGRALDDALEEQCAVHRRAVDRLHKLPSQSVLILLRSSFGTSRMGCILRYSHHLLENFDELQRTGLETVVNCSLDETQWLQASLPATDARLEVLKPQTSPSSAYF